MQFECKPITSHPEAMNLCKVNYYSLIVAHSFVKLDDLFSFSSSPSQAVTLDPNFLDAYINLGNVLKEARIFDR